MVQVFEINRMDDLDAYRLLWRKLLGQTRHANFFQSLDWLEPYWRHAGQEQKLRVLFVSGSEGYLGILPLAVRRERSKIGSVRVLSFPLDEWGAFYGPIGPQPTATLLAGLDYIRRWQRDWDVIDLRGVPRDSSDFGRTAQTLEMLGLSAVELPGQPAAQVDIDGDWQTYWQSRDTRFKKNVDRCRRRLAQQGHVEYIRYRPGGGSCGEKNPRWDLYNACERLAEASWQGTSETGNTLSHAAVREYLRDAHAAAVEAGAADINLLYLDDQPAAFAYCYHHDGHVFGLRMGFDANVTRDGAGTVLTAMMLEDSFARRDRQFDLGAGYLDAKRYWRTSLDVPYRYTHFAASQPKAQILRLGRWAGRRFSLLRSSMRKAV